MTLFKNIILWLIFILLCISVILCVIKGKYEIAVAIASIVASLFIPFGTKDIELAKHKKQFLYEKKYNAYSKYFALFDEFWKVSQNVVVKLHLFKTEIKTTKEEFESSKDEVINLYKHFAEIRDYLSMPGLEILIFVNHEIENKIKEIINIETNSDNIIDYTNDFTKNKMIIERYISVLADLSKLLQKDLGIDNKE